MSRWWIRKLIITEIVVDRLTVSPHNRQRLTESVETALRYGNGIVEVLSDKAHAKPAIYSEKFSCPPVI